MKKILFVVLFFLVTLILFRGWIYRQLVTYEPSGIRSNYAVTDEKLIDFIDANLDHQAEPEITQIIKNGLSMTSKQLNFTATTNDIDPNKLIISKTAHCVGYAFFFAATCNHILKRYKLSDTWVAKPQVGHLYILNYNVHDFFDHPFLQDHDFVIIENIVTGEEFAVDPTLSDYLYIDFITIRKPGKY